MFKKVLSPTLMFLYIYTLTFGVFITELIRIPAPVLFGLPLVFLYSEGRMAALYKKEILFFALAAFFYFIFAQNDFVAFFAKLIPIVICALYFNYFVGFNRERFNYSIIIFYSLLFLSAIVMLLNHAYPVPIDRLREILVGNVVLQSPSGITTRQFTFGYQLSALAAFLFICTCTLNKSLLLKVAVFLTCLMFIYFGMNRSVFVTFTGASVVFLLLYYNYKSVFVIAIAVAIGFGFYSVAMKNNFENNDNILAKNERKADGEGERSDLAKENLRILADHPFGLIFYGKNWEEVTNRSSVFTFGLTSHNAYLMFLTYLGPFLGLGLLILIYNKVIKITIEMMRKIKRKENALLIALCFSFMAISLNALSHNAWLISADGPTVFLFFGILHLAKLLANDEKNSSLLNQPKVTIRKTHPLKVQQYENSMTLK